MIWITTTITLYLIISAAALVVIASEDTRGKDAYYDVRNIGTALIWWVILLMAGAGWFFKKTIKTPNNGDQKEGA